MYISMLVSLPHYLTVLPDHVAHLWAMLYNFCIQTWFYLQCSHTPVHMSTCISVDCKICVCEIKDCFFYINWLGKYTCMCNLLVVCMHAHLTPIHMYTHAHVLLADVISVRSLLHQQEVTVVYTDQQLGDYPLRLYHLYCCTSDERKYIYTVSLSLSLSLWHPPHA